MPATLTTVNAITKEIYGPRVVDQLENEVTLTKRIEKTSQGTSSDVGGKYVTFPLKVRRNTGISYRAEMAALGPAGQQGWNSVRVPLRYGYGRVQMSGQTMELVNTNYQAFASAMTEEMDGLKTDLAKDTNRILWGNGLGVLATIAAATGPLATVDVGGGFDDVKYLDLDMLVDVTDAAGVPVANGTARTISAINETTGVITFSGAANLTVVVGGLIVRSGNYGLEPQGLTSLVSNSATALFNLSNTTEPLWSSTVDAAGGALSESRMIAMCDTLRQKGGKPSAIFTDVGTRRAYFNLLTTQRRFTDTKSFDGGLRGLTFAYDDEIPVVTDIDAPAGKMWFLKEDTFKIYRSKPWYWEDRDGGVWKWVTGYDAFEALMKQYWEFAIDRRNVNGVMTGITAG
jgi:hypothetical protein